MVLIIPIEGLNFIQFCGQFIVHTKKKVSLKKHDDHRPVMCKDHDVGAGGDAVYRDMGNKELRWYPNQPIAYSWDPDWKHSITKIDCEGYWKGADMWYKTY